MTADLGLQERLDRLESESSETRKAAQDSRVLLIVFLAVPMGIFYLWLVFKLVAEIAGGV